ncbi:MAG: hypothetical protein ACOY9J_03610 [Pseudomonadota bacterium]
MNESVQLFPWSWREPRQAYLQALRQHADVDYSAKPSTPLVRTSAFFRTHLQHPWLTTPALIAYFEGEIDRSDLYTADSDWKRYAALAGLPATDATVRWLQRLHSDRPNPAYMPLVRELFSRPPEAWPSELSSLPRINLDALAWLDDYDLVLQTNWWMEAAANPAGLSPLDADTLLKIETASNALGAVAGEHDPRELTAMLRNVRTLQQYLDLPAKLIEQQRWERDEPCPLDGAIGFKPLRSERDIQREAKSMGHCLHSHYLRVLHPETSQDLWLAYAIEHPMRATIVVRKEAKGWIIQQCVGRNNAEVPLELRTAVNLLLGHGPRPPHALAAEILRRICSTLESAGMDYMGEAKEELSDLCGYLARDRVWDGLDGPTLQKEATKALELYRHDKKGHGSSVLGQMTRTLWPLVLVKKG